MLQNKHRLYIVIAFLSIFTAKMFISAAPMFVTHLDKELMNSVIMQIEVEHGADSETGKSLKYVDGKIIDHHLTDAYLPMRYHFYFSNGYIANFKRYINPFHPSVPTPPPNFA